MPCSLVIRAYNEGQRLGLLLQGVRQQTIQDVEIILVDSGSTDDTVAIAESYSARVIHIQPADFTFGRSLNLGVEAASHELVVIASAHVYPVYPDWLERLLEPFDNPTTGLVYGKQRGSPSKGSHPTHIPVGITSAPGKGNTNITKFSEHEIFARWFPEQSDLHQSHPFCNNANAAIRKSLWREHPYDEILTGLEDLAWAKWAQQQGHTIAYVAEAEIIHIHNETPQGVRNRYRREAMAFKHIYSEAHFSLYDFVRMTGSNIAYDLWQAGWQGLLLSSLFSIFWFRWNQFLGTYQGYRQSLEWNWQLRQTFYYPRGTEIIPQKTRDIEPIRYNE